MLEGPRGNRRERTTAEVILDGTGIVPPVLTPPPLNWGTPNTSNSMLTLTINDTPPTPLGAEPNPGSRAGKPRSGVLIHKL